MIGVELTIVGERYRCHLDPDGQLRVGRDLLTAPSTYILTPTVVAVLHLADLVIPAAANRPGRKAF